MNNAKDIAEATGKAFIKELTSYLPLGKTAVSIYEEFQSKQIERKIKRLEEFCSNLAFGWRLIKYGIVKASTRFNPELNMPQQMVFKILLSDNANYAVNYSDLSDNI